MVRGVRAMVGPPDGEPAAVWIRHASRLVAPTCAGQSGEPGAADLLAWPPEGAEPVPLDGFYPSLAAT
ncbi:hypothetical protein VM98_34115, partial [Streptomyces rubellomurinus subsp. indigoferus]